MWVVAAAVAGALVDVVRPGMPVAGAVGEHAEVLSQAFVAGPAEGGCAAFARLDGDGCHAGVGGEAVAGGVAGAVVADLGEQAGGADRARGVFEEREESRSVGVCADGAGDLAGELADLLDDWAQRCDDAEDGGASCVGLEFADDGDGCAAQPFEQFLDWAPAAVGVACEERGQALGAQAACVSGAGVALQERQADRAVEPIGLAGRGAEAVACGPDLVGMDREDRDAGGQQPADEQAVGTLDRRQRHGVTAADQEVPWRVLIGRPSAGRRPVAALGASHRQEGQVSRGPSQRRASEALSWRWSAALCAGQSESPSGLRPVSISLDFPSSEKNLPASTKVAL